MNIPRFRRRSDLRIPQTVPLVRRAGRRTTPGSPLDRVDGLVRPLRIARRVERSVPLLDSRIAIVARYIHAHYGTPSLVEQGRLAALIDVPPARLEALFHEQTGVGLSVHVRTVRVMAAVHLLRTTSWPVRRVADEVGYRGVADLDVDFRLVVRCSPAQYRSRSRSTPASLELGAASV